MSQAQDGSDAATKSYVDTAIAGSGDNLGNHTATSDLLIGLNRISDDGTTSMLSLLNSGATVTSTAPLVRLQDLDNTATDPALAGYISFRDSANTETAWIGDGSSSANMLGIYDNRSDGRIEIGTNSLARVTVTSSGNVGIGTSSPTARLDLGGGAIAMGYEVTIAECQGGGCITATAVCSA